MNESVIHELLNKMIEYYSGDPKRIQHFIKVYEFARIIGLNEKIPDETLFILETATLVHDIGIKPAEEKYGICTGKLQEQEGPAEAEKMLSELNYEPGIIQRVSFLVGHHHTYNNISGIDYQILVEADFLVNLYEECSSETSLRNAYQNIFKTESGKKIFRTMFKLP